MNFQTCRSYGPNFERQVLFICVKYVNNAHLPDGEIVGILHDEEQGIFWSSFINSFISIQAYTTLLSSLPYYTFLMHVDDIMSLFEVVQQQLNLALAYNDVCYHEHINTWMLNRTRDISKCVNIVYVPIKGMCIYAYNCHFWTLEKQLLTDFFVSSSINQTPRACWVGERSVIWSIDQWIIVCFSNQQPRWTSINTI